MTNLSVPHANTAGYGAWPPDKPWCQRGISVLVCFPIARGSVVVAVSVLKLKKESCFFFFLIGTSEYFHTWACFPIALGLTSCKGVLQCSHCCFCFAISQQTGLVWCRAHTFIHRVPLKGFCVWKEGKLLAHFGWNKQRGSWGCGQDWVSCFPWLSASLRCWHPP